MTMPARGPRAVSENSELHSRKHGQRGLFFWSATARPGRCRFFAALVPAGRRPGVSCRVCFLLFSQPGSDQPRRARVRGVASGWASGCRYRRRKRGTTGQADQRFSRGMECPRESIACGGNDYEAAIPAGKIPRGDAGTGVGGERAERVHAFDRYGRADIQANCRLDRAARSFMEEGRRSGGPRRADWIGAVRLTDGCVAPEGRGNPGATGRKGERRYQLASAVASETCDREMGWGERGGGGS